jgi:hypothetical protein
LKPAICQQNGQIPETAHTRHIIQICALTDLEAEGVPVTRAGAEGGGLEDKGSAGEGDGAETGSASGFGAAGGNFAGTGGGDAGFGTAGFSLSARTSISEYRTSAAGAAWEKEANRRVATTDEISTRIAVIVYG